MKPGDCVRIKSFNEIKGDNPVFSILNGFRINDLLFPFGMEKFCGSIVTLTIFKKKNTGIIWEVEDGNKKDSGNKNTWWWHEKWLIPLDFLKDEDFDI